MTPEKDILHRLDDALKSLNLSISSYRSSLQTGEEGHALSFQNYDIELQYPKHDAEPSWRSDIPTESANNQKYRVRLHRLEELQSYVLEEPYDVALRLEMSDGYRCLYYPDLAAGEAYKALLLVDEICDESGEYHEQALGAARRGLQVQKNASVPASEVDDEDVVHWADTAFSEAAYSRLILSLSDCGCVRSACEMCIRMLKKHPHLVQSNAVLQVFQKFSGWCEEEGVPLNLEDSVLEAPDAGKVRRELYPWNLHEPDRFSEEALALLNGWMEKVAPKLEVRATEMPVLAYDDNRTWTTIKQLGVFAKEDLKPGEIVLEEKSLITAIARLNDTFCDACGVALPGPASEGSDVVACEDCYETVFCSQKCLDLAQESYHPAICERDVSAIAKNVPLKEVADALYSLLLLRSLAMSENQDVHPLDLKEVKYIWGDYQKANVARAFDVGERDPHGGLLRTLPFSFNYNILLPLNMLEKLDVNIFDNGGRYDTWVFNTLYAKFRGTASARQGLDRRPDIGAVHPMWCLANHSCDPDVTWEWEGNMRLRVKDEKEQWQGKGKEDKRQPGVKKGDEIMSHYCDVTLDVKNRREWAVGALGGLCQCERCLWEEKHPDSA